MSTPEPQHDPSAARLMTGLGVFAYVIGGAAAIVGLLGVIDNPDGIHVLWLVVGVAVVWLGHGAIGTGRTWRELGRAPEDTAGS